MKFDNIDALFDKIKYFGYENELPFRDYDGIHDFVIERSCELDDIFRENNPGSSYQPNFSSHSECGGVEMYNSSPAPSFDELLNVIKTIYEFAHSIDGEYVTPTRTVYDILDYLPYSADTYRNYWNLRNEINEAFDIADGHRDDPDYWVDYEQAFSDYLDENEIEPFTHDDDPARYEDLWLNMIGYTYGEGYDSYTNVGYYRYLSDPEYIDEEDYFQERADETNYAYGIMWDFRTLKNYGCFDYEVDLREYEVESDDGTSVYFDEDMFNGNDVGVHIRIDVSDWDDPSILRYARLFSNEFGRDGQSDYSDYVYWMQEHFGRQWCNYNEPLNYRDYYSEYRGDYHNRRFHRPSKSHNISTEQGRYGDNVITIEMRAFGVNRCVGDALKQAHFVKDLCRIVAHSFDEMFDQYDAIVDKLYHAWLNLRNTNRIGD